MTLTRLMLLSLLRFWRTNLGVLLGIALASTVITGALLVGDSMRYTLQHTADQRLGDVTHAVLGGDRFFSLEYSLGDVPYSTGALFLEGVVSTPDGQARANQVSVNGIDQYAGQMMGLDTYPTANKAFLNTALAKQLGAKVGDTLILRLPEPSALPIDAALVNASKPALALRLEVERIINDEQGGRFSLRAEQRTPLSLFVDDAWLAEQIGMPGRVNAILCVREPESLTPKLDDLELSIEPSGDGHNALTTPRVFIDASIERDLADLPGQRLLTYMVNTVALGDKQSPYAMVTAANTLGDLDLADDEIALNQWLANDIGASVGDRVSLTYYLPDEGDRLIEATHTLTVARIVPIEGVFADRTLTPDFPSLAQADQLSRWDAGPAIDRSRIRDHDEAYWDDYLATPKAFINLDTGQRLWANRFGTLTAIRFSNDFTKAQLLERIDTEALGFVATDIRAQADAAAVGTVDFGQLFLSLSGFIIIAAIVLAAMLFAMSAQQRAKQLGTLLAIGLTNRRAARLLLSEALIVALLGSLLGVAGAVAYAASVTKALTGVWSGAIAGAPVSLHMTATSLIVGPLSTLLISLLAMALSMRGLTKHPVRQLLAGGVGQVSPTSRAGFKNIGIVGLGWSAAALLVVFTQRDSGMKAALLGFAAGGFFFLGCLSMFYLFLAKRSQSNRSNTTPRLALANLTRRRGRTTTAVFMLGAGLFLVYAVAGFHLSSSIDPTDRSSGTGGFALLVESSQPIRYDLNTELGRDHYALSEDELPHGSVVPLRVSGGDDASCLNLNQTPTPRLLGVDPKLLADRRAFSFFNMAMSAPPTTWSDLQPDADEDGPIPAIADANTAQWALKLAVGDTMMLTDERGKPITIQLVGTIENSILQGSLIIHEEAFKQLYPSTSGYRMLLVDTPAQQDAAATASLLRDVLTDEGATITPTDERLAEYNRVQNTYLAVFQSLGGLGVLLGALGLGIVTARNLLERRSELALLSAVGLSRSHIARIILTEHTAILLLGLLLGITSAWLATRHASDQTQSLGWLDAAILIAPLLTGLAAILLGLLPLRSRRLVDALRND